MSSMAGPLVLARPDGLRCAAAGTSGRGASLSGAPRPLAPRRAPALLRPAGRRPVAAAAEGAGQEADARLLNAPQPPAAALRGGPASVAAALRAFYQFTRPHTMLGTCVSVISVSLLALGPSGWAPPAQAALVQALSSALLMNIAIVGVNQVYDVEIDRVNKPYLPLATGDFSVATGVAISAACAAAGLAIGLASGSWPLLGTLGGSLALGLAYSADVPLLRWKRSPVAAAACILAVRAVLVQLGFYAHMAGAVGPGGAALAFSRPILFATGFMLLFSVVIALFKDIPDIRGDRLAGLRTLSVRLGPSQVYWACIALLEVAYAGAVALALSSSPLHARAWAAAAAHAVLGALLLWRARQTDLGSSKSIYGCYMDVWKLFYAEYLLLPLLA